MSLVKAFWRKQKWPCYNALYIILSHCISWRDPHLLYWSTVKFAHRRMVMHICITEVGLGDGLFPNRHQTINCINNDIFSIWSSETYFSESEFWIHSRKYDWKCTRQNGGYFSLPHYISRQRNFVFIILIPHAQMGWHPFAHTVSK